MSRTCDKYSSPHGAFRAALGGSENNWILMAAKHLKELMDAQRIAPPPKRTTTTVFTRAHLRRELFQAEATAFDPWPYSGCVLTTTAAMSATTRTTIRRASRMHDWHMSIFHLTEKELPLLYLDLFDWKQPFKQA